MLPLDEERVPLALVPKHLDYVVNVLAARPWAEANPILADIQQQVTAHNRMRMEPRTGSNGVDHAVQQVPDSH